MSLARISITLPRDVLAAADRRAKKLDRSRSWVVAEALRQWLDDARSKVVREPRIEYGAPVDSAREVAEARRQHLLTDLKLSPGERLRRASGLVQLAWHVHGRRKRAQVIGFDTYEDFYEWKKARRAGA